MSPVIAAVALLGAGLILYFFLEGGGFGLSSGTIRSYAQNAGFTGYDLEIAVAVAQAESGGDHNAEGDWMLNGQLVPKGTDGATPTSIGLWQIHYTVHPEFDRQSLYDPQYNADAAYMLYARASGSFTDWSTFNNGKYAQFLPSGASGVSA
jgi:Lysozyme like domain